jgi:hypothetical protein
MSALFAPVAGEAAAGVHVARGDGAGGGSAGDGGGGGGGGRVGDGTGTKYMCARVTFACAVVRV